MAEGFVFVTLKKDTGVIDAVGLPASFEIKRLTISRAGVLRITGLIHPRQGLPLVCAECKGRLVHALSAGTAYHDFRRFDHSVSQLVRSACLQEQAPPDALLRVGREPVERDRHPPITSTSASRPRATYSFQS